MDDAQLTSRPRALGRLSVVLFLSLTAFYLSVALRHIGRAERACDGDEIFFLFMIDSLVSDGDLDLSNNNGGRFDNQVVLRDGTIAANRAPGLSAVLAIPHLLVGPAGPVLSMGLIAALTTVCLFQLCYSIVRDRGAALLASLAVGVTFPILPATGTIHPGLATALLTICAIRHLMRARAAPVEARLCALYVSSLPWLHFGNFPLSAFLTVCLLWVLPTWRQRFGLGIVMLLAVAGPLLLVFVFRNYLYGGEAVACFQAFDRAVHPFSLRYLPKALPGLLIDRAKGLITYSPVYFLALAGVPALFRRTNRLTFAMVLGCFLTTYLWWGHYHCWFGSMSFPGRMMLSVAPILGVPLASCILAARRSRLLRFLFLALMPLCVLLSSQYVADPRPFCCGDAGYPLPYVFGSGPIQRLLGALPSYMRPSVVSASGFSGSVDPGAAAVVSVLALCGIGGYVAWVTRGTGRAALAGASSQPKGRRSARVVPFVCLGSLVLGSAGVLASKWELLTTHPRCSSRIDSKTMARLRQFIEEPTCLAGDDLAVDMVSVPAGPFSMGSNKRSGEEACEQYGFPEHEVFLNAYRIGRCEVTNAQYAKFVAHTGFPCPADWPGGTVPQGREQHPVTGICWYEAAALCRWAGGRLPTEAEWEKAACWSSDVSALESALYSVVGQSKKLPPNSLEAGVWATTPVGSWPADRSPLGLMDTAGNVMEFCADWFDPDYYHYTPRRNLRGPDRGKTKVVRGGAWFLSVTIGPKRTRFYARPDERGSHGFRLAASSADTATQRHTQR